MKIKFNKLIYSNLKIFFFNFIFILELEYYALKNKLHL